MRLKPSQLKFLRAAVVPGSEPRKFTPLTRASYYRAGDRILREDYGNELRFLGLIKREYGRGSMAAGWPYRLTDLGRSVLEENNILAVRC